MGDRGDRPVLGETPKPTRKYWLFVYHRKKDPYPIEKEDFNHTVESFSAEIRTRFGFGKDDNFALFDRNYAVVQFEDLVQFFKSEPHNPNQMWVTKPVVVVRTHQDGTPIGSDYEETEWRGINERPPNPELERREIYTPEIALQEFVDNSLQYAMNSDRKIVAVIFNKEERRVVVYDTGLGMSGDDLDIWAEPGRVTETTFPVPWNGDDKYKIEMKKSRSLFPPTLESPAHAEQRGYLNWYGLGGKLASANIADKDGTVQMIAKPRTSPMANYATYTPGFTSDMQVGASNPANLRLPEFEKQIPSSFAMIEIQKANLRFLGLESRSMPEYESLLLKEFANVYYFYLMDPQLILQRIQQLCRLGAEESIAPEEPPAWQLPRTGADVIPTQFDLRINEKPVHTEECFVHRCFKTARRAFSFRVAFPMTSNDGKKISREVNATILYFKASDGKPPKPDERLTPILGDPSAFVIWNGKLLIREPFDFWSRFKFGDELPSNVLQRTVVFLHFSRTFKPKANKEGLDDPNAVEEFGRLILEGTGTGTIKSRVKAFLKECWQYDANDEPIMEGNTIVGVNVVNGQTIRWNQHYKLSWLLDTNGDVPAKATRPKEMSRSNVLVQYFGNTRGEERGFFLKLTFPSVYGDQLLDNVCLTTMIVSAKHIRSAERVRDDFREYYKLRPAQFLFFGENPADPPPKSFTAGTSASVTFVLANADGENVLDSKSDKAKEYFGDFMKSKLTVELKTGSVGSEYDLPASAGPFKHWSVKDHFKEVGQVRIKATLRNAPQHVRPVSFCQVFVVESGVPHEFSYEISALKIGENDIFITATDEKKYFAKLSADPAKWAVECSDDDLEVRIVQVAAGKQDTGGIKITISIAGVVPENENEVDIIVAYCGDEVATITKTLLPGAPFSLLLFDVDTDVRNHGKYLAGLSADLADKFGNSIGTVTNQTYIEDDIVQKPLKWKTEGITVNSRLWRTDSKHAPLEDLKVPAEVAKLPLFARWPGLELVEFNTSAVTDDGTHVCVGDAAVLVTKTRQRHMLRILTIGKDANDDLLLCGEYFNARDCYKNAVPDLESNEVVMSSDRAWLRFNQITKCKRRIVLSKAVYESFSLKEKDVVYCNRLLVNKTFVQLTGSLRKSKQRDTVFPVIIGHQRSNDITIEADPNDRLFEVKSFLAYCRRHKIELIRPDCSRLKSLAAVTYNGKLLDEATLVKDVSDKSFPLVFSYIRSALDEFNHTVRVRWPGDGASGPIWTEYRCLVSAGARPYALHLHCIKHNVDDRSEFEFLRSDNVDFVKVSSGYRVKLAVEVLDESSVKCKVDGTISFENINAKVTEGFGELTFEATKEGKFPAIVELAVGASLTSMLSVELTPPPAEQLHVADFEIQNGRPLVFEAKFLDGTGKPMPKDIRRTISGLKGPTKLFGGNGKETINVNFTIQRDGKIVTSATVKAKCGQYVITVASKDKDGYELPEISVTVTVTAGDPLRLEVTPEGNATARSGGHLPAFLFHLYDTEDNPVPFNGDMLTLQFDPPYCLPPEAGSDRWVNSPDSVLLRERSIFCQRKGMIKMTASLNGHPGVSDSVDINAKSGTAPETLHVQFADLAQNILPAGSPTADARLEVFVSDERERVVGEDHYDLEVIVTGPTHPNPSHGSKDDPFRMSMFTLVGAYEIVIRAVFHGESQRYLPLQVSKTLTIHAGDPQRIILEIPDLIVLATDFVMNLSVLDAHNNSVPIGGLVLQSSLPQIVLVDSQKLSENINYNGDPFQLTMKAIVQEGFDDLNPGDYEMRVTCEALPNLVKQVILHVPQRPQVQRRPVDEKVRRAREETVASNMAKLIEEKNRQIESLERQIRLLEDIVKYFNSSNLKTNWPANFHQGQLKSQAKGIVLPFGNLCHLELPATMIWDIIKRPDAVRTFEAIKKNVSRQVRFLDWIAIDLPDESQQEFFAFKKKILPQLDNGRNLSWTFIQLKQTAGIPKMNPINLQLNSMVIPDNEWPPEVRNRIMSALLEKLRRNCQIFLTAQEMNQHQLGNSSQLCLETGELRENAGQHAVSHNHGAYHGPVLPLKVSQEILKKLEEDIQRKTQEKNGHYARLQDLEEENPSAPKRAKRS